MKQPQESERSGDRFRVAFLFNAQLHQLLHGITTAIALARDPAFDVHVIGAGPKHLDYARAIIERSGGAPITLSTTGGWPRAMPKISRLAAVAPRLAGFDAIALPERTSLLLKRLGITGPRYIHLDHGAGDRAIGLDPRIRLFDFALVAGPKTRDRMLEAGLLRSGAHAMIGYPKYDAADAMRDSGWSPFADDRPIVLYNPHFSALGSWHRAGEAVLRAFADQDRFNLIFAPHVRLFDAPGARAAAESMFAPFRDQPHMHIDLGSDRSVDMSYTMLADIYLGDVSSQVYEFLRTPRPCVFLDPHGVAWQGDPNYAHWRFGPVARDPAAILSTIDLARADHAAYRDAQIQGFAETFDLTEQTSSDRAAHAIATFLRHGAVASDSETGALAAPPPPARLLPRRSRIGPATGRKPRMPYAAQAAALALTLGCGWFVGAAASTGGGQTTDEMIVNEALESNDATATRMAMRSQVETPRLDLAEIAGATAIQLPAIPADWRITDVQIYPSDAGPGVQIALRDAANQPLTLLALHTPAAKIAGDWPRMVQRGKQTVAYWRQGDHSVALVGQMDRTVLGRLAARLTSTAALAQR